MNLSSLPPLIAGIFTLAVGLVTLVSNRRARPNVTFFLVTTAVFWWLLGYAVVYSTAEYDIALQSVRWLYVGVIFIPVTSFHFAVALTRRDDLRQWIPCVYLAGLVFAAMTRSDYFIAGLHKFYWGFQTKVGPLHNVFLMFFFAIMGSVLYMLTSRYRQVRSTAPLETTKVKYVLLSYCVSTIAATDFLPNYGFQFYPIGFFFIIVHATTTTYALVRYQLLDANVAIIRAALFIGVFTVLLALPFGVAYWAQSALTARLGSSWWVLPMGLIALCAASAPLIFFALQRKAEAWLLREQRQYQTALRTISQELVGFSDVQSLRDFVSKRVTEQMQLSSADLFVHTNGFGSARVGTSQIPEVIEEALQRWVAYSARLGSYILAEEFGPGPADVEIRAVRTWMSHSGVSAIVPGWLRGQLISCLVLGPKHKGEVFAPEDFEVLEALARQSALVVTNLQLYEEVAQQKRLAEFGQLMNAINHEFNNVFAIVSMTLQMVAEKLGDSHLRQTIAGLTDDIQRGQYIIRAAGAYRKKQASPRQVWPLAQTLEDTLGQMDAEAFAGASPRLAVETNIPQDLNIIGQSTIPELVANCLRCLGWACDHQAGTLKLHARNEDSKVQLQFAMAGGRDLATIIEQEGELAPEPGKHGGLYYFLVKLIVADHHGTLAIESTPGGGTTLIVELPQEPGAVPASPPQHAAAS